MDMKHSHRGVYVRNLRLKFTGEDTLLFRQLSISIPHGQKVLIVGASGSGKSTLLQVLSGIIPKSLAVPIAYDDIQYPDSWGVVFQDPDTQFCMSYVDEELAFVLENQHVPRHEMQARMLNVLELVGLHLQDIHTPIQTLSQGMKQRLALAAVLLLNPETVFLDEPSALLDPEGTVQIWQSVRSVLQDKTVVVVEHNINEIVDWIERIIMLDDDGNIVADGDANDIFTYHKDKLIQYGIWYPEVWDEYIQSDRLQLQHAMYSDHTEAVTVNKHDNSMPDPHPILYLEAFKGYRGYRSNQLLIDVPVASVRRGSWVAITGHNGAGKSTLLLGLAQLIKTSGIYRLNNELIEPIKKKRKRETTYGQIPDAISLVFQNPELQFIKESIYEEVAHSFVHYQLHAGNSPLEHSEVAKDVLVTHEGIGNAGSKQNWSSIEEVLQYFQLNVTTSRHPYELSLGQKRRLSVLTAILESYSVLLLDEPTFGQDARNTFLLLEKLEHLRLSGMTIIMVTHDQRIAEHFATEQWVIDQGKLTHIHYNKRHNAHINRAVLT